MLLPDPGRGGDPCAMGTAAGDREDGRAVRALAVIGSGPRGIGVLERIAANLATVPVGAPIVIHLIDPHPPGPGRIWRGEQSSLLKLNSMARDVTMFTDESSTIVGPVHPGPSLAEWAEGVNSGLITDVRVPDDDLAAQIRTLTGSSFPTRRLQSLYLDWFYRRALAGLADDVTVRVHAATAREVTEPVGAGSPDSDHAHGRQRVHLDDGSVLSVDVVLYALGHLESRPGPQQVELAAFAARCGLVYVPPAFTADADLSRLVPGENVIVRGMGLAATDLVVLLTEGRGGRFTRTAHGELEYEPSGREPRLHLGSRRGVPYRSKIASSLQAPRVEPRFFTADIARSLAASQQSVQFGREVWPLIAKEMLWGYYSELFRGHPTRVTTEWPDFAEQFAPLDWDGDQLRALVARTVPDPRDRLDIARLDRPLASLRFESRAALQQHLREHIRADIHERSSDDHSPTLALFYSLLYSFFDFASIAEAPRSSAGSRTDELGRWFPGFFSYVASGPPGHRLEELLALSRAGTVQFLGPDMWARADAAGCFVAGSPSVDGHITARALVDARLPECSVTASASAVLRSLVSSGVGSEERVDGDDSRATSGKLRVRPLDSRVVDASGTAHPLRFAVGPFTTAPFVGAFSRPGTNAVSFRENDRVARAILDQLATTAARAGAAEAAAEAAAGPQRLATGPQLLAAEPDLLAAAPF